MPFCVALLLGELRAIDNQRSYLQKWGLSPIANTFLIQMQDFHDGVAKLAVNHGALQVLPCVPNHLVSIQLIQQIF